MGKKNKILYAVLNWGLGHASRSIPIIRQLQERGYVVHLASSGVALDLLRKECPDNPVLELPDYKIKYPGNSSILNAFHYVLPMTRAIRREKQLVQSYAKKWGIELLISDNRLGCLLREGKNAFISHQLCVRMKNALMTAIVTRIHRYYIQKYDVLWVPDFEGDRKLAGALSRSQLSIPTKFLGPLSRFSERGNGERDIDYTIVLSGPEPARTKFQERLLELLIPTSYRVVLVTGSENPPANPGEGFEIKGLLTKAELQGLFDRSAQYCGRSGYSSIMDLYYLGIPCLLIPTPGQTEQEYLAKHLSKRGIACRSQSKLSLDDFYMAHASIEDVFDGSETEGRGDLSACLEEFLNEG